MSPGTHSSGNFIGRDRLGNVGQRGQSELINGWEMPEGTKG